ncbi:hypothetical protein BJ878DRAFT_424041, partial [Calycina marina]
GAYREFCSTCSTTMFWDCDFRRDLIDISVGLFEPEEGVGAERWLEWASERVSFKNLAMSKSLVGSLKNGLRYLKEGKI